MEAEEEPGIRRVRERVGVVVVEAGEVRGGGRESARRVETEETERGGDGGDGREVHMEETKRGVQGADGEREGKRQGASTAAAAAVDKPVEADRAGFDRSDRPAMPVPWNQRDGQ